MSKDPKKNPQNKSLPFDHLPPQRMLNRDEVETVYGIPKRFLEVSACKGGGPIFVKIGRLTRYRVEDLEAWIKERRFESTSEADLRKDGE